MAACLLAAVCRPKAVACVKGRFFDRAHEKLTQLAKFATNELVPVDMRDVSALLARGFAATIIAGSRVMPPPLVPARYRRFRPI